MTDKIGDPKNFQFTRLATLSFDKKKKAHERVSGVDFGESFSHEDFYTS
jgi:hypothetical protein